MKIRSLLPTIFATLFASTINGSNSALPNGHADSYKSPNKTGAIIAYGSLIRNSISKPTATYFSSFGDGFCMKEEISFAVDYYLLGSGPTLVEAEQHGFNSCMPLVASIGFAKAVVILKKVALGTPKDKVMVDASSNTVTVDGEPGIIDPNFINHLFLIYGNNQSILTDVDKPQKVDMEGTIANYLELKKLKSLGILDFEKAVFSSRYTPVADPNIDYAVSQDYFKVTLYKYIRIRTLVGYNF
ncbi:MAG: hypothetical protein AAGF57_17845 [Pseudomonadota bacterium]